MAIRLGRSKALLNKDVSLKADPGIRRSQQNHIDPYCSVQRLSNGVGMFPSTAGAPNYLTPASAQADAQRAAEPLSFGGLVYLLHSRLLTVPYRT